MTHRSIYVRFSVCGRHAATATRGLTLIELLVVLVVLAALSTIALRATEGLGEQARYDATRRTLEQIESAIIGESPSDTNASFVADIGRLPKAVGADSATQLAELYDANAAAGLPAFGIQTAPGDSSVMLACGWRGPYLRLPFGSELRDGWSKPFGLFAADETAAADTTPITIIRSFGADNAAGGSDFNADAEIVLHRSVAIAQPARQLTTLTGSVWYGSSPTEPQSAKGQYVIVRIYGPVNGALKTLAQSVPHDVVAAPGPVAFAFTNVPRGPRVLRAYQTDTLPATADTPIAVIAGTNASSAPLTLSVNGQNSDLILRDR